jgi:hypothetical protein
MAKRSKGNVRSQAVILPARAFRFEIEAILTSEGFDPFCPPRRRSRGRSRMVRRWQAPEIFQYSGHLPPSPEQNGLKPRKYF